MSFSDTKLGASWSSSSTSQEKGDTSNSGSTKMSFVETATSSTKEGNSSTMPSSSEETVSLERGSEHKVSTVQCNPSVTDLTDTTKLAQAHLSRRSSTSKNRTLEVKKSISSSELFPQAVEKSDEQAWSDPESEAVSGDPRFGNLTKPSKQVEEKMTVEQSAHIRAMPQNNHKTEDFGSRPPNKVHSDTSESARNVLEDNYGGGYVVPSIRNSSSHQLKKSNSTIKEHLKQLGGSAIIPPDSTESLSDTATAAWAEIQAEFGKVYAVSSSDTVSTVDSLYEDPTIFSFSRNTKITKPELQTGVANSQGLMNSLLSPILGSSNFVAYNLSQEDSGTNIDDQRYINVRDRQAELQNLEDQSQGSLQNTSQADVGLQNLPVDVQSLKATEAHGPSFHLVNANQATNGHLNDDVPETFLREGIVLSEESCNMDGSRVTHSAPQSAVNGESHIIPMDPMSNIVQNIKEPLHTMQCTEAQQQTTKSLSGRSADSGSLEHQADVADQGQLAKEDQESVIDADKPTSSEGRSNNLLEPTLESKKTSHVHFNTSVLVGTCESGLVSHIELLEDQKDNSRKDDSYQIPFSQVPIARSFQKVDNPYTQTEESPAADETTREKAECKSSENKSPEKSNKEGRVLSEHSVSAWLKSYLVEADKEPQERLTSRLRSGGKEPESADMHKFRLSTLNSVVMNLHQVIDYRRLGDMMPNVPAAQDYPTEEASLCAISELLDELLSQENSVLSGKLLSKKSLPKILTQKFAKLIQIFSDSKDNRAASSSDFTESKKKHLLQLALDSNDKFNTYVNSLPVALLNETTSLFASINMESWSSQTREEPSTQDAVIKAEDLIGYYGNTNQQKPSHLDLSCPSTGLQQPEKDSTNFSDSSDSPLLSDVVDVLIGLLSERSMPTKIFLKPKSSSASSFYDSPLVVIANILTELIDTAKQTCTDNEICLTSPTCSDENSVQYPSVLSVITLFEKLLQRDEAVRNEDFYHGVSHAFSLFKKYHASLKQEVNHVSECEDDSEEMLKVEIIDVGNSLESGMQDLNSVNNKRPLLTGTSSMDKASDTNVLSSESNKFEEVDQTDKNEVNKEIEIGLRNGPSSAMVVSALGNSSQSMPCASNIEFRMLDSSESVDKAKTSRKESCSSAESDLSAKDTLPGYLSPPEMLNGKHPIKVNASAVEEVPTESPVAVSTKNEELIFKKINHDGSEEELDSQSIASTVSSSVSIIASDIVAAVLENLHQPGTCSVPSNCLGPSEVRLNEVILSKGHGRHVYPIIPKECSGSTRTVCLHQSISSTEEGANFEDKTDNVGENENSEQLSESHSTDINHGRTRSDILSNHSGLSYVGHLATSEVLQRDYIFSPNSSSVLLNDVSADRYEIFAHVQSDQTNISLKPEYRLLHETRPYSSSEPHTALHTSGSSDIQWSFNTDFQEGDGESSNDSDDDDDDDDFMDGWVDVGSRGDNEAPELELFAEDERNVFNAQIDFEEEILSSESSSHSSQPSDEAENRAARIEVMPSNISEYTTQDNDENISHAQTVDESISVSQYHSDQLPVARTHSWIEETHVPLSEPVLVLNEEMTGHEISRFGQRSSVWGEESSSQSLKEQNIPCTEAETGADRGAFINSGTSTAISEPTIQESTQSCTPPRDMVDRNTIPQHSSDQFATRKHSRIEDCHIPESIFSFTDEIAVAESSGVEQKDVFFDEEESMTCTVERSSIPNLDKTISNGDVDNKTMPSDISNKTSQRKRIDKFQNVANPSTSAKGSEVSQHHSDQHLSRAWVEEQCSLLNQPVLSVEEESTLPGLLSNGHDRAVSDANQSLKEQENFSEIHKYPTVTGSSSTPNTDDAVNYTHRDFNKINSVPTLDSENGETSADVLQEQAPITLSRTSSNTELMNLASDLEVAVHPDDDPVSYSSLGSNEEAHSPQSLNKRLAICPEETLFPADIDPAVSARTVHSEEHATHLSLFERTFCPTSLHPDEDSISYSSMGSISSKYSSNDTISPILCHKEGDFSSSTHVSENDLSKDSSSEHNHLKEPDICLQNPDPISPLAVDITCQSQENGNVIPTGYGSEEDLNCRSIKNVTRPIGTQIVDCNKPVRLVQEIPSHSSCNLSASKAAQISSLSTERSIHLASLNESNTCSKGNGCKEDNHRGNTSRAYGLSLDFHENNKETNKNSGKDIIDDSLPRLYKRDPATCHDAVNHDLLVISKVFSCWEEDDVGVALEDQIHSVDVKENTCESTFKMTVNPVFQCSSQSLEDVLVESEEIDAIRDFDPVQDLASLNVAAVAPVTITTSLNSSLEEVRNADSVSVTCSSQSMLNEIAAKEQQIRTVAACVVKDVLEKSIEELTRCEKNNYDDCFSETPLERTPCERKERQGTDVRHQLSREQIQSKVTDNSVVNGASHTEEKEADGDLDQRKAAVVGISDSGHGVKNKKANFPADSAGPQNIWIQHVAEPQLNSLHEPHIVTSLFAKSREKCGISENLKQEKAVVAVHRSIKSRDQLENHINPENSTASPTPPIISRCFDARPQSCQIPADIPRQSKLKRFCPIPYNACPENEMVKFVRNEKCCSPYAAACSLDSVKESLGTSVMSKHHSGYSVEEDGQDKNYDTISSLFHSPNSSDILGTLPSDTQLCGDKPRERESELKHIQRKYEDRQTDCRETAHVGNYTRTKAFCSRSATLGNRPVNCSGAKSSPHINPGGTQGIENLISGEPNQQEKADSNSGGKDSPGEPEGPNGADNRKDSTNYHPSLIMGTFSAEFGHGAYVCEKASDFDMEGCILRGRKVTVQFVDAAVDGQDSEPAVSVTRPNSSAPRRLHLTISAEFGEEFDSQADYPTVTSGACTEPEQTGEHNDIMAEPTTPAVEEAVFEAQKDSMLDMVSTKIDTCPNTELPQGSEESLKRRTIPMLSNTYKIASQDVRTYLIQKELLESQVRRMQVEIAGLQSEKRQLTDHSNAVQARSSDLESQLAEVTNQLDVTKARIGQEITEASRKLKAAMETKMDALHHNNIKLSGENEKLKAELVSSKQSKSESERTGSKLNEQTLVSLKSENSVLKAELAEVKTLLNQSEDHVISLEEKKRSAEVSLAKLSKVKDFLQLSEGSGQGAADKIIRSLEKRLRVTEERFFKERADRGHTLSEVEEKLLAENSNLLVAEKELSRQLQRSQDRCRHLELKVKDMREENMNLRLALPLGTEIPTSTRKSSYDLSNSVHSTIRAESKLMTSDMKEIMTHVQRETGLSGGQEVAMVCELWRRYDVATHKLQQWEQELFQLKITHGNIALGLQNLREMKAQYEEKIRSAEEEVEDILNEKNTMETTYKQQLSELVSERHEALAKLQTMEDLMAGLKAENEALQERVGEGEATHDQTVADLRAEIEQLQSKKEELEVKLTQLSRQTKLQEGEIDTLKSEVEVKDRSLEAATHDLEVAEEKLLKDGLSLQEEIDSLNEQVVDLQAEVQIWKEKYHSLSAENIQMEEKVEAAKHSAVLSKVKAIEEDESEKSVLEHDLSEREADLKKLTNQYQTVELELEQTRRNLLVEAERRAEVENHLENIQEQLNEKQRSVERLGQSEHQSSRQYDSLKGALDSMMQELRKSQASVKRLQVELSQEKDRTQRLQESFTQGSHGHNVPGEIIQQDIASYSLTSSSGAELRLKNLDRERDQLKQELSESLKTVEFQRGEISELHERVNSVTQELRAERETLCQLAADKSDLEQHLQSCIEERDEIYKQKEECDHDLHKLEQNLHDVITKFDLETRQRLGNFQSDYANLGPDAHNLIEECVSLRLLLEGKDSEIRMLTDKISRQNDELDFLRHRVEMLLSENLCHRNDITRHTAEATQKMEELRSSAEVNDLLVTERARLQLELEQTRSELGRELEHREQRNAEVAEILRKFDQSAESRKTTQEELHKLDNKSVALETELRHTNRTLAQLETENQHNKAKLERANDDIRSLTNANATLEKNLEIEKHTGFESRQSLSKLQDELREKTQQLEFVKHEKAMLLTNLDMERKTADNLKTQLETKEGEITALKTEVKEMAAQIESFKGRLLVSQESFEQVCKDKQNVYGDYQELCRQLNEKEKQLEENKAMSESSMENIHQEFSAERVNLKAERSRALAETEAYRDEIRDLKEQLSQKEVQLCTFGRTLQELEEMTKQNQELEDKLVKMNSAAEDTKILINSHRTEIMTLRETHKALEEKYAKLDAEHKAMEDDFRSKRQGHDEQLFEFRQTTAEMKTSHEMEKFELREKLSRTEGQLETAQANLATLHSAHKDLQGNCHNLESTLQEVKSQLQQTATQKHALAERMATLESQVSNSRRLSEESSGKLAESQVRHSKVEQDLAAQLAKNKKLEKEFAELEAAAFVHRSNMKAKQDQVDLLQAEVNKLRQVLESHRQQMASKYKKAAFDLKQQTNNQELERNRLTSQCDQLTSDLEQAREQITVKSRENLKLQEDLFNLEAQLRDATSKLRQATDSLRHETEMQEKLSARIQEQDEELKKVRVFLSQKGDEAVTAGEGKMAWNDINRSMKELSMKMDNLKSQKITDNDSRDHKSFQRFRKHLAELETELHTEKALHQITRSSLQASEDDCQRLRRQLRSKQRTLSGEDRSEKSRMEKINEIIAKSQTQAQLLMASGGYHDYSSSRDMSLISPRSMSHSPDNSLADHPALFNTSLNNNNGTSSPPASSQSPRTSTPSSKT